MNPVLVENLGWTLLHLVWQGALIGCATALALLALRRADPRQRYAVACTALLACLLWPATELALRVQGTHMVSAQMRFADAMLVNAVNGASGGLLALIQAQLGYVVAFWCVCAGVLTLRMGLGLLWIRRAARIERGHPPCQAAIDRLASQFRINRPVRLAVVERLDSPLTAGWWRPVVLVPATLLTCMPPALLEALLAHEMAHIRRHDYLLNLVQNVIEILLFYHPAVWFISRRIRLERELVADQLAARHTGQPRHLAQALAALEQAQFAQPGLALAASGGQLLTRVTQLLRPERQALNWKAALPVFALATACLGAWAHASVRAPSMELLLSDRKPIVDFATCPKPNYPGADLAAGHTGSVKLAFQVSAAGTVLNTEVRSSSGHPGLDHAARDAIQLCRFIPGMRDGLPMQAWVDVEYVWTLE